MRHVIVSRVAFALAGVLVASAAAFVWLAERPPAAAPPAATYESPVADGAALFAKSCSSCHTPDTLRPQPGADVDAARQALESFLRTHGETSNAEDRLIAEFLAGDRRP